MLLISSARANQMDTLRANARVGSLTARLERSLLSELDQPPTAYPYPSAETYL